MQIVPVSNILASNGLRHPLLTALTPNVDNYTVLLMQPKGDIEASVAGVFNRHRDLARQQFGAFLEEAQSAGAHLAVTPEYSMPWEVLIDNIKHRRVPALGNLWVFGCESIKWQELTAIKNDLLPHATVLFEPLDPDPQRFVDPVAYVFLAPAAQGDAPARLVILVQFKTHPMGDPGHYEINGMQRGTGIYKFGGIDGQEVKLVSLICSDAFAFLDGQAAAVSDRALVIHIQLNPKPRNPQYRLYRDRLLHNSGDATELICLNWAGNVEEWCNEQAKPWHNISGSAWYLKPTTYDDGDNTLKENHRRGLYYTYMHPLRVHALFFNYQPAAYLLTASKVVHINVAGPLSHRRGPQLTRLLIWSNNSSAWMEQAGADDGFLAVSGQSGVAQEEVNRIYQANPFTVERALALCAGEIAHNESWHQLRELDSCMIDASEIVMRMTFCQDTHQRASDFRSRRLRRCHFLWSTLSNGNLPPALSDLAAAVRLEWLPGSPHQNVTSSLGRRATVVYMGEATVDQAEIISKRLEEFLGRSFSEPDDIVEARQRLVLWYRDDQGNVLPHNVHAYMQIDQTGDGSPFDFTRSE